jgi:hypothetical protein
MARFVSSGNEAVHETPPATQIAGEIVMSSEVCARI